MKTREKVTAFDFENAFKALSELNVPKVNTRQERLSEQVVRSNVTNALIEDYYNVNSVSDLEEAQDNRKEEIAQAKLARIEKIVDINAESPEDILPSYVGKNIIQCPQCMTLFYKDPSDIEISEEDENLCNVSETCQHCGNDSGYTIVGKVAAVEDVEEDPEVEEETLNTEELPEEELGDLEQEDEEGNDLETLGEEENEEESLEELPEEELEEVEESLNRSLVETYYACAIVDGEERRYPFGTREEARKYIAMIQNGEAKEFEGKKITSTWTESLTEGVDKELDDKLKAHNEYIDYLKAEIEKAEKDLENAKNEFVKKSIEVRLNALKTDLEKALPEALKDEVENELPNADEIEVAEEETEEVKESLTESTKPSEDLEEESAKELLQDFVDNLEEDLATEEKLAEFEQALDEEVIKEEKFDDVSREEFRDMLNNPIYYESLEEDEFEDLDECSLNEHISGYLTNVYENVKSFEATNCSFEDNKLIVEGNINFASGSINKTNFEFIKEGSVFKGKNTDLCEGLGFTLSYKVENKAIITESFRYKYAIGKNSVEGIIKK